jgi:hypothetical protein
MTEYTVRDSLPLEMITIQSAFDYDTENDDIISLDGGFYLVPLPHKDKMLIATNKDRTKGIVLYNSYCFGRHKEFTITENERRMILWYEDDDLYCGYVYDKAYKVAKYFEDRRSFGGGGLPPFIPKNVTQRKFGKK